MGKKEKKRKKNSEGPAVNVWGRRSLQIRQLQMCTSLTCIRVYFEINLSLATGVSYFFVIFIQKLKKQI